MGMHLHYRKAAITLLVIHNIIINNTEYACISHYVKLYSAYK